MKKILLFLFLLNFQFSFSQVITIECNNMIITVNWEEIANNPNAYLDWDEDGDIDEDDAMIYLYETYDCDNLQEQESCGDYVTIVIDCAKTLVLLTTNISFSSKYVKISLNILCSIVPLVV